MEDIERHAIIVLGLVGIGALSGGLVPLLGLIVGGVSLAGFGTLIARIVWRDHKDGV